MPPIASIAAPAAGARGPSRPASYGCSAALLTAPQLCPRTWQDGNNLERLVGIGALVSLVRLSCKGNQIKSLDGFTSEQRKLSHIDCSENAVASLLEVAKLGVLPNLKTLTFIGEPPSLIFILLFFAQIARILLPERGDVAHLQTCNVPPPARLAGHTQKTPSRGPRVPCRNSHLDWPTRAT